MVQLHLQPAVRVLFQTERFAVVEKPAGCVVHRNKFSPRGEVALVSRVRDQLHQQASPVHRLDGGTSGCVLFAFDSATTAVLQAAMAHPSAAKEYLALCRGDASWLKQWHVVDRPVKGEDKVEREATTRFACIGACEGGPERSSLVVARPATGRWHQIRRHCNGLAHPIIGDAKHGDTRVNRWWREERGMQHLGLHCAQLRLELPGGEELRVRCPVRLDLLRVMEALPWWEQACLARPELLVDVADADAIERGDTPPRRPYGRLVRAGDGPSTET